MKAKNVLYLFVFCLCVAAAPPRLLADSAVKLVIETSMGNIVVAIYPEKAPHSSQHFLSLIDKETYTEAAFYRATRRDNSPAFEWQPGKTVQIQSGGLIQGGLGELPSLAWPTVVHENTQQTGLSHKNGALAWARPNLGNATTEFFICIDQHPYYDFAGDGMPDGQGLAVFGQVIEGMALVRQIHQQATRGQIPADYKLKLHQVDIDQLSPIEKQQLHYDKLKNPVLIQRIKRL